MLKLGLWCVAGAAAALLVPRDADACGGFFCSQFPVDQAQENILFAQGQDGSLEVHVQISYTGTAEEFAWILPFPRAPVTMDVGSDAAMTLLARATQPQFRITQVGDQCDSGFGRGQDDAAESPTAGDGDGNGAGVQILAQQEVGPYDAVVIDATDATALQTWLTENDYDIPEETLDNIAHYVEQEFVFVALKLQKDQSAGDIQPFVARFDEGEPCIPLILTAIAAVADMPVVAFFLGAERFVPENFYHVQLNLARIDWTRGGSNYRALATEALAEAPGGRAYLTEFAGAASAFATTVWSEDRFPVLTLAEVHDPVQFMNQLVAMNLPPTALVLSLLQKHMPMPGNLAAQGVTPAQYYGCLLCYQGSPPMSFDPGSLVVELNDRVIAPLEQVQGLIDAHPYMTRLITLISPENMTVDPDFVQNPDVGDVSNIHDATFEMLCDGPWPYPMRITLPDGSSYVLEPDVNGNYDTAELAEMPASLVVEQMSDRGPGVPIIDNRSAIEDWKSEHDGGGCGCRVAGSGTRPWSAALLLLGLVATSRRWRRGPRRPPTP